MKLTLELELTDEQADALTAYTAEWNGPSGTSTIEGRLIEDAVLPFIELRVSEDYVKAVQQMGEDAKSLPYSTRKQLLATIRSQIPS